MGDFQMKPDAAFVDFFAGPFQRALEAVEIPGMPGASWDRKAAYLLWSATKPDGGRDMPSPSVSEMTTDKIETPNRSIFD